MMWGKNIKKADNNGQYFFNRSSYKPANETKLYRTYLLAIIVSLVFLVYGIAYLYYAGSISRDDTVGYIKQATHQTDFAVTEHINEEFDTLIAASIGLKNKGMLEDDRSLLELSKVLGPRNAFVLIGVADPDGNAVWIDSERREHKENISSESYFLQAMKGNNALSDSRYENISESNVFYYAVPIYNGNTDSIKGVIFAAEQQDELSDIIEHSLYAGKGLAHIIDQDGNYILKSRSPLVVGIGNNIFHLPKPLGQDIKKEILNNLKKEKAGYLEREFYGENRLVSYSPLDINNWSIFYAVPENMVSAGLKQLTLGAAVFVCAATCVFILFFILLMLANRKNRKALENIAFIDPVSGKRNYQKFLMDAEEIFEKSKDKKYVLTYANIKGFKYINDIFGRTVGNQLLKYFANIQEFMSLEGEVSGHLSADSFVSLRKFSSKKDLLRRFESVAHQLSIFPETFSKGYKIEIYGGAYAFDEKDGSLTINDMIDRAMEAQKAVRAAGGTDRLYFYSNEMREEKIWETEVEARMEKALENNEFQIFLQPKIDIQNGDKIMGAEALVRWSSSDLGFIPPGRFINLFESNGFILKLDKFIFENACRYYSENIFSGKLPKFILSVNVSRLGLIQPDFINVYSEIKERYSIPDGLIELEFTESLAVENYEFLKKIINAAKRYGFLCSMDDFGSGFSSLNMLKAIHVDVLKLDRQFFLYEENGTRGKKLIKYIIKMAKSLDMKTVAEGIDDEEQVKFLRNAGCDAIQGYVFSKPMPMEDFGKFVDSWNNKT